MKNFETVQLDLDPPFAKIVLTRAEVRNAMNLQMIIEVLDIFNQLQDNREIRGIVITGAGDTFCAGGDLKEMQSAYTATDYTAQGQTAAFDQLLKAVNRAPQVVVARIEGAAMGGGLGLICVTDIAIATIDTIFALPEVRLGIVPAMISPYVIQRVGLTTARRLMLTGARFDGQEAVTLGITHDVAATTEELDLKVEQVLGDIREAGPHALAACKELIFKVKDYSPEDTTEYRAQMLDELRQSKDGQEGMLAFIQKRKPDWSHNK